MGMGFQLNLEPKDYCGGDDSKRQDLEIVLPDRHLIVDFSVIVNTCPSHYDKPDALERAAKEKVQKHGDNVTAKGHIFLPLIFSTSGEMHPDVDKFVQSLATRQSLIPENQFRKTLLYVMSDALHAGVAQTILTMRNEIRKQRSPEGYGSNNWGG